MSDTPPPPGLPPPPRPRSIPPDAKRAIANAIAAEMSASGVLDQHERDEMAHDIAMEAEPHLDGFKIACGLEARGWDCCMEMAEALDTFGYRYREELLKVERAWVEAHRIKPELAVGTRVRAKVGHELREGYIRGVSEHAAARYLVRDAADPEDSTRSWVVAFEDVEALKAEAPAV